MSVIKSLESSSYLQIRSTLEAFKSGLTPEKAIELIQQLAEYANSPEQGIRELESFSPKIKVIYNGCYGGCRLSNEAAAELGIEDPYSFSRTDARVTKLLEEKGSKYVSGSSSCLAIEEVPAGSNWSIQENDGWEYVTW